MRDLRIRTRLISSVRAARKIAGALFAVFDDLLNAFSEGGAAVDQCAKMFALKNQADARSHAADGGVAGLVAEQGDFAEVIAILQNGDARGSFHNLGFSADQNIETVAGVAFTQDVAIFGDVLGGE